LAIFVVLILLILAQEYFLVIDVVSWAITVWNAEGHMVRELQQSHLVHASSAAKEDILLVNAKVQLRNAEGHMVRELQQSHLVHASSAAKEDILLVNAQVQLRFVRGILNYQPLLIIFLTHIEMT
jgi:hypothetical protein